MGWRDQITKAVLAGKPGGPHPGGIHVYHSSPHDFDKFDWSKLRSGEGANTYGAGFYFAENPAVSGQGGQYWQQFLNRATGNELGAAETMRAAGFDRAKAMADLQKKLDDVRNYWEVSGKPFDERYLPTLAARAKNLEDRLALIASDKPIGPRTYEVNINARPELMLDWDKPLAQMSPEVQARLKDAWLAHPDAHSRQTGEQIYQNAQITHHQPGRGHEDAVIASQKLAEAGIPGIRYLDQGSRGARDAKLAAIQTTGDGYYIAGKGQFPTYEEAKAALGITPPTYNYVVTDPSKLDILAKYGVVGGAPVGMGAIAAQDRYQQ